MVKVQAPLFSADAQGSMMGSITYKKNKLTNFVSLKPASPRICIVARTEQNNYHSHTVSTWHILHTGLKSQWDLWCDFYMPLWSGFNAFYHHYMTALNMGDTPSIYPPV